MLCALTNISKTYGDHTVLHDVSLTIDAGQKIGLVGPNGAGKTTLLKILRGDVAPDGGRVRIDRHAELGYLPQTFARRGALTIGEFLDQALGDLRAMASRLRQLEAEMTVDGVELTSLLGAYAEVQGQFERRGGYDIDHRQAEIMAGLGLEALDRSRPMHSLSGGEATRVGLGALLLGEPNLLLLDEPTNHLDFAALDWLESYVERYRGGALVVSHDRRFLNRTVDAIIELDEHAHTAKRYAGSYDDYAVAKAHEQARWAEAYALQQEEIFALRRTIRSKARQVAHNRKPKDGDKMAYDHKGGRVAGAVARNVRNAEERLRRIEADPIARPPKPLSINPEFDPDRLVSSAPLLATDIGKAYDEEVVLDAISVAIDRRSRVALVGPNGSGKSTLLRILAGVETADAGAIHLAASAVVGYLDQEPSTLPPTGSVLAAYATGRAGDPEQIKAELLGYGLFTYPDLLKPVQSLSIGQKRKLQLARLIAARANLLLLDEPTNHLSLDVVERFEAALRDFPGAVIAVSHDRHFLSRFAEEVWYLRQGRLERSLSGWSG